MLLPALVSPALHAQALATAVLEGRLNDAIPALEQSLAQQPSPANELLLCRALISERRFDDALPHCQAAADAPNAPATAFLWLGRVQGHRAQAANPLSAFSLARKVKAAFSRAVELDPNNPDTIDDLGEFLVQAPSVVGGGVDQARALAASSLAASPVSAHRLLAMIAAKAGDTATAEREYRATLASSHGPQIAGSQAELARFLQQHGSAAAAASAARAAIAADHPPSPATVSAVHVLAALGTPPAQLISPLEAYLASPGRSDLAPAYLVHLQLAHLYTAAGDPTRAAHEQQEAHRLAPNAILPSNGHSDQEDDPTQVP